jgi:hypothetical protein
MTVAEHDDVRLLLEQLGSIDVRQKDSLITDGHANDVVAIGIIVVAADERDRRDLTERFEDVLAADVAGMQNRIDALQRRERFRSNQTVRVGDDADAQLSPRCWPSSPSSSLGIGL